VDEATRSVPVKRAILAEARRILRPGGTLVLGDTPQHDLHDFRGFYEPCKDEWLAFDPAACLAGCGFDAIDERPVALPLWTLVARSPR